jgi:phage N-6-adenine-methyltransferase
MSNHSPKRGFFQPIEASPIVIDPRFKSHVRKLDPQEHALLEASILADGCRDALVVWQGENILLDGHNRYAICTQHNLPYRIEYKDFDNDENALDWLIDNQAGRRNATPDQLAYYIGRKYNRAKQAHGGARGASYQNDNLKSHEKIAKEHGIGDATVIRAGKYHEAVEKLADSLGDETRETILNGEIKATREEIQELAKDPEKAKPIIQKAIETDTPISRVIEDSKPKTPVMQSSESNEYYTPAQYIEAARKVMGYIDLDPASCEAANRNVQAKLYYSIEDNGLAQDWQGRVWLNPPYGRNASDFAERLLAAYRAKKVSQAIMLVNANITETKWFAPFWDYLICFTNHRINFVNADEKSGSTHGSIFVYLGEKGAAFIREFRGFGVVVRRVDR